MHVTLRQLRVLLAVAETGSFSAAARTVGLSQPAVSQSIRAVEQALGVPLLHRSTRRVVLTPAGEQLVSPLRDALKALEDVLTQAQQAGERLQRVVRVAATPSLSGRLLPRCLADVAQQFPGVAVQLKEQPQDAALESVRRGTVDFALAVGDSEPGELQRTSLLMDRFVLVCRSDHPFSRRDRVSIEHLGLERLIVLDAANGGRQGLDRVLAAHGVSVDVLQEVASASTAFEMVKERLGVALLPASCVPTFSMKQLRCVGLEPDVLRDVSLFSRRHEALSEDARAVHDTILARAQGGTRGVSRPLTLLVPFPKRGPVDGYGRAFAKLLAARVGKDVVVTNTVGLGGAQGVHAVTRSRADGYTIGIAGNGATVFTPANGRQPLFDVFQDLTFLSGLVRVASVLVVGAHIAARNFAQMRALARLHPGRFVIGAAGKGSSRMLAEMLGRLSDIPLTHKSYDGLAPALDDLAKGKLDMVFGEPSGVLPLVQAGKAFALVVTGDERCPLLKEVPSAVEVGLPDLATDGGYCLVAPPSLPAGVLERLSGAVAEVLQSDELNRIFASLGVKPDFRSGPYYENFIRGEQSRWQAFMERD